MADEKKPLYVAFFLDPMFKEYLLKNIPPKHNKVFADHLTVAFGKTMDRNYPIGLRTFITGWMTFEDDKGQAIFCTTEHDYLFASGQIPHITISCAGETPPSYSTELMTKELGTRPKFSPRLWLGGQLDYFPRTLL